MNKRNVVNFVAQTEAIGFSYLHLNDFVEKELTVDHNNMIVTNYS